MSSHGSKVYKAVRTVAKRRCLATPGLFAATPRLRCHPFDQVIHVLALLGIEEPDCAAGTTGAAHVGDDVHVAAGHPEVRRTCLDEPRGSAEVLNLPGIGRRGDQSGEAAVSGRPVDVREQIDAVAYRHGDIAVCDGPEPRLAEVAILAAGGLRAVELTLTDVDAGNNTRRADLRYFTNW